MTLSVLNSAKSTASALALAILGCAPQTPGVPPTTTDYQPVLTTKLASFSARGLPLSTAASQREIRDYLEASEAGGRLQRMAQNSLAEMDPAGLTANLLALVEDRFDRTEERLLAYPWLQRRAVPAAIPRLVLRLKYEKDLGANIHLAATLLRLGNGAGLDALHAIIVDESSGDQLRHAATVVVHDALAVAAGEDMFTAAWEELNRARDYWHRYRQLEKQVPAEQTGDVEAEIWRMIERLSSQPLRPVDDARFVLSRLRCELSMPVLLSATNDDNMYVREHSLQTISWIGYPAGEWDLRTTANSCDLISRSLADPRLRARGLEALGAFGHSAAAELAVSWLLDSDIDTATAAADCLLRCAGPAQAQAARVAAKKSGLSPEARLSLHLLLLESDTLPPAGPGAEELAQSERLRRETWASMRRMRPGRN